MLNLYVDNSRINPRFDVQRVLRTRLASGISCGAIILGEGREGAHCAELVWTFDGCAPVEIAFDRDELESRDGAERVAEMFLAAWRDCQTRGSGQAATERMKSVSAA